jgi:hypothetical protein
MPTQEDEKRKMDAKPGMVVFGFICLLFIIGAATDYINPQYHHVFWVGKDKINNQCDFMRAITFHQLDQVAKVSISHSTCITVTVIVMHPAIRKIYIGGMDGIQRCKLLGICVIWSP